MFLTKFDFFPSSITFTSNNFTKNNFFLKNLYNYNYVYYESLFLFKSIDFFSKNFFLFTKFYSKLFKNFLNFFYLYSSFNYKFLTLDFNHNLFNHLNFDSFQLIKFNSFFNTSSNIFKKQQFFLVFKNFLIDNKIKLILIFDFELFHQYLNFLNHINVYMFSFILPSYNFSLLDFFIFKNKNFDFFEKMLYYSSLYVVYNAAFSRNNNIHKLNFFKRVNYLPLN